MYVGPCSSPPGHMAVSEKLIPCCGRSHNKKPTIGWLFSDFWKLPEAPTTSQPVLAVLQGVRFADQTHPTGTGPSPGPGLQIMISLWHVIQPSKDNHRILNPLGGSIVYASWTSSLFHTAIGNPV